MPSLAPAWQAWSAVTESAPAGTAGAEPLAAGLAGALPAGAAAVEATCAGVLDEPSALLDGFELEHADSARAAAQATANGPASRTFTTDRCTKTPSCVVGLAMRA